MGRKSKKSQSARSKVSQTKSKALLRHSNQDQNPQKTPLPSSGPISGEILPTSPPLQHPPEPSHALPAVPSRKPGDVRSPPPDIPSHAPAGRPLVPPHWEDASLRDKFDMHVVAVAPSSQISSKIRQTISLLKQNLEHSSAANDGQESSKRPTLVALVARATAVNRCISIVEIGKREFVKDNGLGLFQYTGLWRQLEELQSTDTAPTPTQTGNLDSRAAQEDDSESDDAFESYNFTHRTKVRNVTCMVVYLSTTAIPKLKEAYG
jgi:hypothetical protein